MAKKKAAKKKTAKKAPRRRRSNFGLFFIQWPGKRKQPRVTGNLPQFLSYPLKILNFKKVQNSLALGCKTD